VDKLDGALPERYLLIDTALPRHQVERLVRVGDLISFDQEPIELGESILAGSSLDNRSSIAALTIALQELQSRAIAGT
jgi:endoglucanase